MYLPIKISSEKQEEIEIVDEAFLDCGATGKFIDWRFARKEGIKMEKLERSIEVFNVDGTPNKQGTIRHYVDLKLEVHGKFAKNNF